MADWTVQQGSAAEAQNPALPILWSGGFLVLAGINLVHIVAPPSGLDGRTRPLRLLLVIPLYVYMAILSALYFILVERHLSGQAIYLHKFIQHPSIYLGIGLYVWAGMLFSKTRLASLGFEGLRPWKLPPSILAWFTAVLGAVPTAYSGASGIFVIAAGREIFDTLRASGASRRLARAATAMAGSLGVVLRPCLVVVLVAALNKQVTTAALFEQGLKVFALTSALLLVAMLIRNREPIFQARIHEALPSSLRALGHLLPYLSIAVAILLFFGLVFGTWVNEYTAPYLLPFVLLGAVVYESWRVSRPARGQPATRPPRLLADFWGRAVSSTRETAGNAGALLMLMTASVGLGGVIERADLMAAVPESFGSRIFTMAVLVVILVIVGMLMDALGAVVLVSVTVAGIAYRNGIEPVHFWMVVLVAFELGYLTPPVAINHLLTRQVVGREAEVEHDPVDGPWARYEHVLLPMAVMGTALLLVAFVPLVW